MTEFSEYTEKMKQADPDLFLGRLAWYTVSNVTIKHEKLVQLLVQNNLSGFLPKVPADSDAFRRVCSNAEKRRVATGDSNVYDNYLVRKMGKGGKLIAHIVRERVDANTEKVAFVSELCKLTWTKTPSGAVVEYKCQGNDAVAESIAQEIIRAYHAETGTMNSYAVRELIRRVVMSMNATNVRGNGGGVYFINHDHNSRLDDLEGFAKTLPGDVQVHSLPLLDDNKQREMLRRAYESEAIEDLERTIDEIIELKTSGKKVTSNVVAGFLDTLQRAKAKDREYSGLLQTSLDSAASRIQILTRQVMELSAKVEDAS